MLETIVQTRLYTPALRPNFVSRPRLVKRLNQGLSQGAKLTLISAPAGYGKTSLVAEWGQLSSTADPPLLFSWLSLAEQQNNPSQFLRYLLAAMQKIVPGLDSQAAESLGSSPDQLKEAALAMLVNQVATLTEMDELEGRRYILVLDDFHLITAPAVHEIVQHLLNQMPAELHLALISRQDLPWSLARMRAGNELTEITAEDLAFTLAETGEFLNRVMGLELSTAGQSALYKYTEGWIAGLQLFALSLQGLDKQSQQEFVFFFSSDHRYIADYLANEVLQRRPAGTKDFLLRTSILEFLTAPLCDSLTGREDGQAMLEQLEKANLFIVPLDDQGKTYRYHHLFARLLRRVLAESSPDLAPELHLRASQWLEMNGRLDLAIDHAFKGGDEKRAAGLIEQNLDRTLRSGDFVSLAEWLHSLSSDAIAGRPKLSVYYAILLLLTGQPLEQIESQLQKVSQVDITGVLAGEVTLARAILALVRGDTAQAYKLSYEAVELLPEEDRFLQNLLFRNLSTTYKLTGDVPAALKAIERSAYYARTSQDHLGTVVTMHQKAEMIFLQGQLPEAMALCQRALELDRENGRRPSPVSIKALVTISDLYREWNDLEPSLKHLEEAIKLAKSQIELFSLGAHVVLARVQQAKGDFAAAQAALDIARDMALAYDVSEVDDQFVAAQQARLWLGQGDLARVDRWVEQLSLGEELDDAGLAEITIGQKIPYYVREFELTTMARFYLQQERPDKVLGLLAPLRRAAEKLARTGSLIEFQMLRSLAWRLKGDKEQAIDLLKSALELAEPGGYVRLFLDIGAPMKGLLQALRGRNGPQDYLQRLLAAFDESGDLWAAAPPIQPLVDPLSDRELEILRYLNTYMSSTEIAQELSVSPHTIRFHTKNIYSKLGVHRRADAVEKAKSLALL